MSRPVNLYEDIRSKSWPNSILILNASNMDQMDS